MNTLWLIIVYLFLAPSTEKLSSPIYKVRETEYRALQASKNPVYLLCLYGYAHSVESPEAFMWVEMASTRFTPSKAAMTANLLLFNKTGRLFLEKEWKHDYEMLADPYIYDECVKALKLYYSKVNCAEPLPSFTDKPDEDNINIMIEEINRVRAHERGLTHKASSWSWVFSNSNWLTNKPLRVIIPITPEDDK